MGRKDALLDSTAVLLPLSGHPLFATFYNEHLTQKKPKITEEIRLEKEHRVLFFWGTAFSYMSLSSVAPA